MSKHDKSVSVGEDEQSAFKKWLHDTCPSGDCEEVQRQWLKSYAYADWNDWRADQSSGELGKSAEQEKICEWYKPESSSSYLTGCLVIAGIVCTGGTCQFCGGRILERKS